MIFLIVLLAYALYNFLIIINNVFSLDPKNNIEKTLLVKNRVKRFSLYLLVKSRYRYQEHLLNRPPKFL